MRASQSRSNNHSAHISASTTVPAQSASPTPASLTGEERWLWECLKSMADSDDAFKGEFTNFYELLPLLPHILDIAAEDLQAIATLQAAPTSSSDCAAASSAAPASARAEEATASIDYPWLNFTATEIRKDFNPEAVRRASRFYRTNRFFREQLDAFMSRLTEQLVALVLNGREEEAKALIEACPFLLERRATVTCPVGRVYKNVTAYEAALYAGDTQMCEMMHPIFERLGERGETMRLEQCHTVFPDGVHAVIEAQQAYDFKSLIGVINEASADDVESQLKDKVTYTELGQAINRFRENFVMLSRVEQLANLKHLLKAFRAYADDERIAEWDRNGAYDKMCVFWRQVIGFVQLYLPECHKQVFHEGLYDFIENKKRLSREVDFKDDRGLSLHILEDFSGCGSDFAADGWAACGTVMVSGGRISREVICFAWETYVEQIISNLERLCGHRQAARIHP